MSHLNYVAGRFVGRFIKALAIRTPTLHRNRFDAVGPCIVAPTHESHLEPVLLSAMVERKIDWMARLEFYKHPIAAWVLEQVDCFPVNRFGVPVKAIRTAIKRLGEGKTIGIFPEGGCARGADSCTRGGRIKLGACVVALRANVPIVPVVMINTHCLVNIGPWIPFGRATVWVNFGEPIYPPTGLPRREARFVMGQELQRAYVELHSELCDTFNLERAVPYHGPPARA